MKRIYGVRAGLIGDMIMALPILQYFDKVYPNSYKYWMIHQKCAQAAPLFFNHPLIDRIKITDGWVTEGRHDLELKNKCDIQLNISPPVRDLNWRNEMDCIAQTARMAKLDEFERVISPAERIPILHRWFPSYSFSNNPKNHGYIDNVESTWSYDAKRIAIWPFANYGLKPERSPSVGWWEATITWLIQHGYEIYHYGWITEPTLSLNPKYHYYCNLSFFDQIRSSLEAYISIGTDSGSMWVLGAYNQPQIVLMTFHEINHKENPMALAPPYEWTKVLFNPQNINLIKPKTVIQAVEQLEDERYTICKKK